MDRRLVILTIIIALYIQMPVHAEVYIGSISYFCDLGEGGNGGHIDLQNAGTSPERFYGSGKIFPLP